MPLPPPSVASRRGLSGVFVDFDLLPELLQMAAAGAGSREGVTSDWSARLERGGFTDADIDPEDGPERISVADSVAADAWRFAERMALIDSTGLTPEGRRLVSLAGSRDLATVRHALVQVLAKGVTRQLRGQGGVEVLPLLYRGAGALAATDNLWARQCPGLTPRRGQLADPLGEHRGRPCGEAAEQSRHMAGRCHAPIRSAARGCRARSQRGTSFRRRIRLLRVPALARGESSDFFRR